MTALADFLNPDKWIASGRNLADLAWPPHTENEREAVRWILADKSELAAHLGRWGSRIKDHLVTRFQKVRDVLTEEQLRDLWEQTRTASLS